MHRTARFPLLLLLFTMACATEEARPPAADATADVAAVNAVREAELAALRSGDTSGGYLAADAVMMPPGGPAVSGIEDIRAWTADFMSQFSKVDVNYNRADVTVAGDWAFEHYAGTLTMTPAGGGEAVTQTLKGIHIYRRQDDGSWKMVRDIWNVDTPPPSST